MWLRHRLMADCDEISQWFFGNERMRSGSFVAETDGQRQHKTLEEGSRKQKFG